MKATININSIKKQIKTLQKDRIKLFKFTYIMISGLFVFGGLLFQATIVPFIGVCLIWVYNVIWALYDIKSNLCFLMFQLTFFLFILGRPICQLLNKEQFFFYDKEAFVFCILAIYFTLIFMNLGAEVSLRIVKKKSLVPVIKTKYDENTGIIQKNSFLFWLRFISLMLFIISFAVALIIGIEKIAFRTENSYTDYYISFTTSMPYIIRVLGSFMPYSLCLFLSTKPGKRACTILLLLYVLSAIPNLIVGVRNPIIQNLIFAFIYYWLRDNIDDQRKWIGKKEKILIAVVAPALILFMFAFAYIRSGMNMPDTNILLYFIYFIYQQGVTFNVLSIGYNSLDFLPPDKHYTFGGVIDYYSHGSIAQLLFGAKDLGSGNSVTMGTESNSFAHNMAYVMHPDYLEGQGWGSSYILELYADYGYIGIIIYSILLGILLISAVEICKKNYFLFTMILVFMMQIFFTPRSSAMGFVNPVLQMPFLVCVLGCTIGAKLLPQIISFYNKCKEEKSAI